MGFVQASLAVLWDSEGWGVVRDRDWGLYSTLPFVPVLLTKLPSW